MHEAVIQGWQARVREAAAAKTPLAIRGGGTKAFYGEAEQGEPFDTRAYAGIVDYEPTELVVTARAGTLLADVERTLREAGQMLAFEPPHFAPGGTLGGTIATGLSGPRRPYAGAVRDHVLGVKVVDGRGELLTFGGRVMKNVAGFDVARLMTGALGTLGIVAEASLKCVPQPRAQATRVFELSADEGIRRANEWGGKPLPLSATCQCDGRLYVRLSGAAPAVEAAAAKFGGAEVPDGEALWTAVRDHAHPFFAAARDGAPLWRLSVRSTAPHTDLGAEQLIEWGGALRWLVAPRAEASKLRAWAAAHGGHATLFAARDRSPGVFHPLPPALAGLHARLKAEFDPHGILNPGRMAAGGA
ncbi:MAG: glycolate oxidase subunit GlcE [Betaproteobacteria bacterium]|nr:MAG: glycolate oxidase subunit GlcE [Betaproteobacteria bacterium]